MKSIRDWVAILLAVIAITLIIVYQLSGAMSAKELKVVDPSKDKEYQYIEGPSDEDSIKIQEIEE